jgi:hypothetical protein
MRLENLDDVLKVCAKNNISPNEYLLLYCLLKNKPLPPRLNDVHYKITLFVTGYLNNKYELLPKALNLFYEEIDTEKVEQYRLLWPSLILPSGKNARCSLKELQPKFKWFFDNYEYDWNTIMKATQEYIKYYSERGYNFMRTSSYFIYKESVPKFRTSTLAEWCDKVLNGNALHESFDIDI